MSGKTKFKKDVHTQFVTWLEEIKGAPYKFRCYACGHIYEMINMGQQALTSHMTKSKNMQDLQQVVRHHLIWKICGSLVCLFSVC